MSYKETIRALRIAICKKLERIKVCECTEDGKMIFNCRKEAVNEVNQKLDTILNKV